MKVYKSYPEAEIKAKFKPISLNLGDWPAGSSIKEVLDEEIVSGEIKYVVKMKDSQVIKISQENLSKNYNHLIKKFQENLKQNNTLPEKRRVFRERSNKRNKRPKTVDIDDSEIDIIDIDSDESDSVDDPSREIDELVSDSESESDSRMPVKVISTTQRGRKSVKPKSFVSEFYSNIFEEPPEQTKGVGKKAVEIALYEDEGFIDHHSNYCFQCNKKGEINGNHKKSTQVYIGRDHPRGRLLLCNHCSFAFHNNCITLYSTIIDKNTKGLTCQKCAKSTKCSGCNKATKTKDNSVSLPFRCSKCFRSFHKDCIIPNISSNLRDTVDNSMLLDLYKFGKCMECDAYESKAIDIILTEKLVERKTEYLVKWKDLSFRKAEWVSADWVSHYNISLYKNYLKKRESGKIMPYSDDWLMIDRIINVKWDSQKNVKSVLAVFKERDYSEACWDEPPSEEETALYASYKKALNRYTQAMNVEPPRNMKTLIGQVRSKATSESYEKHELKRQPKFVTGGTLMKHQMEALNWLLYQWEQKQSCILADDMGLGKTIQIITFLYYLFKKYKVYPFYIVVPNSTATNWIREFEKWAPEMTVAPYFGRGQTRKLALDNEIFDRHGRLKCHAVVATYESALESTLTNVFWPVMVVDESQRLKNDNSLLFKHLKKLRVDHVVLLTGTPLQNNLRELFNIMHFIHPEAFVGNDAEDYEELTTAQVEELHSRLRPFFLRRTKEEVLKTLPPRYELIVPVSMTTLQKEVYKQCLSGEIHETLAQATKIKRQSGMSNIFVNLRKLLNHPYLLEGVEAAQPSAELTQKNMIDASAKLKLFHQMLPKLIERGHRILIFSTMTRTLDVLEDYFAYEKIKYARIDGGTMERDRVRRIDAFNDADSQLSVFLLSTRAGGVGINLATADTVIIWDSDFNPYADLQAIGRAHRIGQNKMVLIYRFMTRYSVEEKVLQIAKKRIALEHVVVERMKEQSYDDLEDIESILKYGTEALFSDDDSKDVVYDASAIENLLNREQYRATATEQQQKEVEEMEGKANEKGAMNFSFAKVWKSGSAAEELEEDSTEEQKDTDFWEHFLMEQQAIVEKKKEEQRLAALNYGRGARKRANVVYKEHITAAERRRMEQTNDDIEFVAVPGGDSDSDYSIVDNDFADNMSGLADLGNPNEQLDGLTQLNQQKMKEKTSSSKKSKRKSAKAKGADNTQNYHVNMQDPSQPQLTEEEALNIRKKQTEIRNMQKLLKHYYDRTFGVLKTYIDRDIEHVKDQAKKQLDDRTFNFVNFHASKMIIAQHIQESISKFTLSTVEKEKLADFQAGIDSELVIECANSKRIILHQNLERTMPYILSQLDATSAYLKDLLEQQEAIRLEQYRSLKYEIQRLKLHEEVFMEKHRVEERRMKAKHRKQIMQIANAYNIHPDGIPPGPNANMDAMTERLISQMLEMNLPLPKAKNQAKINNPTTNTGYKQPPVTETQNVQPAAGTPYIVPSSMQPPATLGNVTINHAPIQNTSANNTTNDKGMPGMDASLKPLNYNFQSATSTRPLAPKLPSNVQSVVLTSLQPRVMNTVQPIVQPNSEPSSQSHPPPSN